ncbi:hypothetical protein MPC4_40083 [Methylocella tundrae]|uniref:Uncharacterized protein n=1 Tax=Methylocella tundrae TaxID=227605 RepID=A0A8B6MBR3_METTU|nr:hypothetical protein MPC1_670002 [Methylocella tundrae]VTZ51486.1 hypothetical protein MPC4_40083 [Methylocella tundrae]
MPRMGGLVLRGSDVGKGSILDRVVTTHW